MSNCIIFCAADFDGLLMPITEDDYIIAADGGYTHVRALGMEPDCILGDFDSLGYVPDHANVFPVEKDDTDSMLAVRKGLELGYRRFELYGALDGDRLDHTIANLQTLCFLAEHGARGYLVGLKNMVAVVKNGGICLERGTGILSVFCLGEDAKGVTLKGLKYPLENGTLTSSFPLGLSNHFTDGEASISVADGTVLVLYDVENGVPQEVPVC